MGYVSCTYVLNRASEERETSLRDLESQRDETFIIIFQLFLALGGVWGKGIQFVSIVAYYTDTATQQMVRSPQKAYGKLSRMMTRKMEWLSKSR